MKAIYVICSIVLVFGFVGCKNDSATEQSTTEQPASSDPVQSAETQRDTRPVSDGHDYNFLTHKILYFNTVMGAGTAENDPKKGDWLHLNKDGTYQAGRQKEKTYTGQWSYAHDAQLLFLRPDSKNYKMSEWKVMASETVIVLVGTQTYGNNSIQIQCLKVDSLP